MDLEDLLSKLVEASLKAGASYASAQARSTRSLRVEVQDGELREVKWGLEAGVGVRVLVEGRWGFASASLSQASLSLDLAKQAVESARAVAQPSRLSQVPEQPSLRAKVEASVVEGLESVPLDEKVELALKLNRSSLSLDGRVKSATTVLSEAVEERWIYTSHARLVKVKTSYLYLSCSAYAFEAGVRQRGFKVLGGVGGFELARREEALKLGVEAASTALRLLNAPPPPPGKHTCILDPEMAGTFIHEAFGHACEADLVLQGSSILAGKLGSEVASRLVTVVDDPSIQGLYGWTPFDDEAVEAERTVLVEDGVLKGYLHNLESSKLLGARPNGHARAQGFDCTPLVRMTNTFIEPGDWSFEELLQDTKRGLYVKGSGYGYVDVAKGLFSFKCREAYLIEEGELTKPLRDVALSGLTLETLKGVDAVADDLSFNAGVCGKEGQSVPVTDGSPHIRVREVVVGGG